jgi:acetyltransferase-like isoleucine patch superfamily enzyme
LSAAIEALARCARVAGRPWLWAVERAKHARCLSGEGTRLFRSCRIESAGRARDAIRVGARCQVHGRLMVFAYGGAIRVGDDCFIGEGSEIWSAASVTIGARVFVSHGVNIHDTSAHPRSARLRHAQFAGPAHPEYSEALTAVPVAAVVIEDDAWIGFNAVVLRGVTIGRGAIVGAASVVTQSVAPYSVVAGNPARPIGEASA